MSDPGYTAETAPPMFRNPYKALEPDPNADYGTFFPLARDRTTGEKRWAMPSAVRDTLGGWLDLLAGLDSGEVTPRAAAQIGMGGLAAGSALAPRGAMATGGAPLGLAMDEVSRLARARALGFNTELPLFHGTGARFSQFSLNPPTPQLWRDGAVVPAVSAAENPQVADLFSVLRANRGVPEQYPNILPLFARFNNVGQVDMSEGHRFGDVARTVGDLFAGEKYDAVRLLNHYSDDPPFAGQTIWYFRDPAQLRSRFAAFDPAKRDSPDLLAGVAAPGPAPVPGFNVRPEADASGLGAFRRMLDDERVY